MVGVMCMYIPLCLCLCLDIDGFKCHGVIVLTVGVELAVFVGVVKTKLRPHSSFGKHG